MFPCLHLPLAVAGLKRMMWYVSGVTCHLCDASDEVVNTGAALRLKGGLVEAPEQQAGEQDGVWVTAHSRRVPLLPAGDLRGAARVQRMAGK